MYRYIKTWDRISKEVNGSKNKLGEFCEVVNQACNNRFKKLKTDQEG